MKLGKRFSSSPVIKTLGNSNPLAAWMVISFIRSTESLSSSSPVVSSDTSFMNRSKEGNCGGRSSPVSMSMGLSGSFSTKPFMALKSSPRFSYRSGSSSMERSSCVMPEVSAMYLPSSKAFFSVRSVWYDLIFWMKSSIFLNVAGESARPWLSGWQRHFQRETLLWLAAVITFSIVVRPIPRCGLLMIRRRDSSSFGLMVNL